MSEIKAKVKADIKFTVNHNPPKKEVPNEKPKQDK